MKQASFQPQLMIATGTALFLSALAAHHQLYTLLGLALAAIGFGRLHRKR